VPAFYVFLQRLSGRGKPARTKPPKIEVSS